MNNLIYQGKWDSGQMAGLDNEFCVFTPVFLREVVITCEGDGIIAITTPENETFSSPSDNGTCSIVIEKDIAAHAPIKLLIDDAIIVTQIEMIFTEI